MGKDNRFSSEGAPKDKDFRRDPKTMKEQLGVTEETPLIRKNQGTFLPHQDQIKKDKALSPQPDRPRRVDGEIRTPKPQVNLTPEEQTALHLGKKLIESKIFSPEDAMRMLDALSKNAQGEPEAVIAEIEPSPTTTEQSFIIPKRFEVGQVFLLPRDHISEESRWKIVEVLEKEGGMMMQQTDGAQKGRTEKFSFGGLKEILSEFQLEKQREMWKESQKKTAESAPLQKETKEPFGKVYFTPGHIIVISTPSGNESYRVRNTKDGMVEVASINHREKGVEFFSEEELKKKLAQNKKEAAPSYPPIKDLFTMFSQKNEYSVSGLLAWKKKWLDSGEIDLYREKNTNLSISQDQLDAAKKAIDVDIATLQDNTATGEARRSAITNIGLSGRLLIGVHHPIANNIKHHVKPDVLHIPPTQATAEHPQEKHAEPMKSGTSLVLRPTTPSTKNILRRPKAADQSAPEELVAPTAAPKEVSPEQEKVPSEKEISLAKKLKIVNPPFETRIARLKQNKLFGVPMWKYLGTATLVSAAFYTAYTSPKKEEGDVSLATTSAPDGRQMAKFEWHKYFHLGKTNPFYREFPKELSTYSTNELSEKLIQKYAPSYVQYSDELSKISSALEMIGKDVQEMDAKGLYDKPLDKGGKELSMLWKALDDVSMTTSAEKLKAKTFRQAIKEVKDKVTRKEK